MKNRGLEHGGGVKMALFEEIFDDPKNFFALFLRQKRGKKFFPKKTPRFYPFLAVLAQNFILTLTSLWQPIFTVWTKNLRACQKYLRNNFHNPVLDSFYRCSM